MNKKIVFLGALLFVGNVAATEQDDPWYIGARIGVTHYSDFENNQATGDLKDDDSLGGGAFLGYNINDWFALETAYTHLGKAEVTDTAEISSQALELVGKFTWELTDSFDLFAKAGGALHYTKGEDDLSGRSDTGFNATVGLGLERHFTDNLSARLEYQLYRGVGLDDSYYESSWDTHLFSLGLVYSWGAPEVVKITEAPVVPAPVVVEEVVEAPAPVVVVPVEKVTKIVNQTAQVDFARDKKALSASSAEQLQPIINHLNEYPEATIVVVGHTDSRGAESFNQKLSEQRAEAVSTFLMKEYSIASERITTMGKGELEPIATNSTKEGQAQNRRVSVYSPSLTVVVE